METISLSPAESPELLDYARRSDWREQAILDALRVHAQDGNPTDVILAAVRMHTPGLATVAAAIDRKRFVRFLRQETDSIESLVEGESQFRGCYGSGFSIYTAWSRIVWAGYEIEIVLPPGGDETAALAIGPGVHPLRRLLKRAKEAEAWPIGRCLQYSDGWKSSRQMDNEIGKVTWNDIVLPTTILNGIRESVDGFIRSRQSFEALGFRWRRGILLIGPPGTGKTMVCKAAASALPELPFLYVRDLKERYQCDSVRSVFKRARKVAPCILAIEDLDGFVNESNRAVFLNELDGFHSNDGILLIASSNHPEEIDAALLKRPSRFDRVFHIGLPGYLERLEICRRILARPQLSERFDPDFNVEKLAESAARDSERMTPAYLKEAFLAAALVLAQRGIDCMDYRYSDEVLEQIAAMKRYVKKMRDPESAGCIDGAEGPFGFRRWE